MKKTILITLIIILGFSFFVSVKVNKNNNNDFGDKQFLVESGQGVSDIADNLVERGFLKSKLWFKVYILLSGKKAGFYNGDFELRTDMDIKELVHELQTQRDYAKEQTITLLEGWSVNQIDQYLTEQGLIDSGELNNYTKKFKDKSYFFLLDKPRKADLEGYLYPDTYRVYEQATVEEITARMLNNFDDKLTDELRDEIKSQKKSIYEVLTLASVVEKEMFGYENRRVVADVFLKRLNIGMALQSDATVNYVTKKGIAAPSLDDISIDNPYNTYKNIGLPPGPICNPSIEAIRAVLYPTETDYWYFLNTKEGDIIFSKTHDEHVQNKFKYLK